MAKYTAKVRLVFTTCERCNMRITTFPKEPRLCGNCLEAEREHNDSTTSTKRPKRACEICGMTATNLVQDHDHETWDIRGILCNSCNSGLGMFRDNPEVLEKAADYLRRHKENPSGIVYKVSEHSIPRTFKKSRMPTNKNQVG